MAEKLKPCPFCGYDAILISNDGFPPIKVVCSNEDCGVETPLCWNEYGAINRWNDRINEAPGKA